MAMFHLMLGLPKMRVEPILLSTKPSVKYMRFYRRLREEGVKLVIADRQLRGLAYWFWLFRNSVKQLKESKIPIAHCHGTKEALVVGLAAKITGRKIVYTVEGDPVVEAYYNGESLITKMILALLFRLGLKMADLVAGCSNWMASFIKTRYGVDTLGIWNPIDYSRFQRLGWRDVEKPTVVSVSRLDVVKDVKTLLLAAGEVIKDIPNVRFLVVGDGPLRGKYEKMVEKLGIGENVFFLGFRDDVDKILESASVVVMTSIYEPFGMAAAEAQAAGKPVITAETGGLVEIVENKVTGFYFKAGDWRTLASLIKRLLTDRELRVKMGEAAAKSANRFSPEAIASRYLHAYLKVLR